MPEKKDLEKLNGLIKDIRIAMLTTHDRDGFLRSRPMVTQNVPFDGTLWFFMRASGETSDEIKNNQQVNTSYADHDKSIYVSLSGEAEIVRDSQKAKELWNPFVQAWFPNGPEDPDLALLKVTVLQAEYWDSSSSKMVRLFTMLKAAVTGERPDMGENKKLQFK
jgi:general stress protein 26